MKPWLLSLCLPFLLSGTPFGSPQQERIPQIVGPSVLMNARLNGEVNLLDLREQGRQVPGISKHIVAGRETFVLGDLETVKQQQIRADFVVPPSMIEFHHEKGVPQIAPRAAKAKMQAGWPLFDVSEQFEFDGWRIPDSQRFDYGQFRSGNFANLPKNQPFIVACRVGHRSQLVVQTLRKAGYNAHNLDGGLWQWECDGLEMTR